MFATFIAYWSQWQTVSTLIFALPVGCGLMGVTRRLHLERNPLRMNWASARWLFPYLIGLAVTSYMGRFGHGPVLDGVGPFEWVLVDGRNVIRLCWDLLYLTGLGLCVYVGTVRQAVCAGERGHS